MIDQGDFATVRFSTDDLPEKDRVTMWREHFGHTALRIDIEPAEGTRFHASMASRSLPGLDLLWGNMSPARVTRTRELVADGNDDLALVVNCTGPLCMAAGDREVVLRERDAVLIRSDDVVRYDRCGSGRTLALRIPRSILSPLVADLDDAVMRHITRKTEALRLLTSYAGTLPDANGLAAPGVMHLVVGHIHDLVALTLGATRDAAHAADEGGVRAARLQVAKAQIIANGARRDLSVTSVAAYVGVTPRHLQRLFEADGTTFSSFLLGQRLARAYGMLCDPRFDRHPVSTIAYEAGFGDLSYFNRSFRKLYGGTPRDVRQAAEGAC
ncbi:MAG: AraC family transcriptional regulator [Bradyrhizobium sp.]